MGQLRTALTSRAVIDQAKGILMALHSIQSHDAFDLLVKASQEQNMKLRDVAANFVGEVTAPRTGDDPRSPGGSLLRRNR
jgi:AmiR/NasT family two-component response regulator